MIFLNVKQNIYLFKVYFTDCYTVFMSQESSGVLYVWLPLDRVPTFCGVCDRDNRAVMPQ